MHLTMVPLHLTASQEAGHQVVDHHLLGDLLWVVADVGDHLEHVYVQAAPGRLGIVLYLLADSPRSARAVALAICRRALHTSPLLCGWRVAEGPGIDAP
ncbi:hypothetical protein [Streptomyces sp. NPDC006691]|uniref:hypothetical protein n=1 Tax=Streptomyces sp. NPDC006691 TaxID=3364757 RepID=UPI0036CE7B34